MFGDYDTMKAAKAFFGCVLVTNLVVYFTFVLVMLALSPSRQVFHRCGAVMLGFSIAFLFIDRRAAGKGFLVLLLGFVIGILFPEL